MKKAMVVIAAVALVGGAYADIYANMQVGFGVGGNGANAGIVNPTAGTTLVLQLIGGGGDGLDYVNGSQVVYNGGYLVSGNDSILATIMGAVTADAASDFSDYAALLNGIMTADNTADTWVRVGGAMNGDWVYEQAVTFADLDSSNPLVSPETVFYDAGGAGASADGSVTVSVIPEPATLGLMGIAGLGMFLARKKAHK